LSKEIKSPNPSPLELEILQVLWSQGPSTVRAVTDELGKTRGASYHTCLKMLQIMAQKGLVLRDESERAHVYEAAVSAKATEKRMLGDVLERCFEGSTQRLLVRALEHKEFSDEELEEIRRIVDSL
jgi:predicted transcriptional regulator